MQVWCRAQLRRGKANGSSIDVSLGVGGEGMKALSAVLVAAITLFTFTGIAAAKTNPRDKAKANAEGFVQSYLPSAPGQPGICDMKTQEGFFDKNKMYLASCSTADGSLQIFSIVNATKGSLDEHSPYLEAQLNNFCGGAGSAYAAGVKGKFVNIFAGRGDAASSGSAASVAMGLQRQLADTIKNTAGQVAVKVC